MKERTRQQWTADVGAIVCLALLTAFVVMVVQTGRIMANPAYVTGVVESKRVTEGNSESPEECRVQYSFSVTAGGTYRGTAGVSRKIYDRTSVGDPIEIQYAADDPGNNRVIGATGDPQVLESAVAAITVLVMFVWLGPRRWLALRHGEPDPLLQS
jgi:uncharacterized protein DUF3592